MILSIVKVGIRYDGVIASEARQSRWEGSRIEIASSPRNARPGGRPSGGPRNDTGACVYADSARPSRAAEFRCRSAVGHTEFRCRRARTNPVQALDLRPISDAGRALFGGRK